MTEIQTTPVLRSAKVLEHALSLIFSGLLIGCAVMLLWMVFDLSEVGETIAQSVGYPSGTLSHQQSFALCGLVLVQLVIWMTVVWQGREIFAALGLGDVRSASIAASQTARVLWIMLFWGIVAHALGTVIATCNFPEGQRSLSISIGSAEISTVFAALLASFTSHAFVLGAALWQDHVEVI